MQTRKITLVTYRTLDPVEIEIAEDATCMLCANPAIGGMVFPEPYELSEGRTLLGNIVLCRQHVDELTIDDKPI